MPKFKVYGHAGLRFKLELLIGVGGRGRGIASSEEERNEDEFPDMPVFDFHTVVAIIIKWVGGYKEAISNYCKYL